MKSLVILIDLRTFFHVSLSYFENIKWFLELYEKMYVKMAKFRLCKKSWNFGTNEILFVKIWHDCFKASNFVMW